MMLLALARCSTFVLSTKVIERLKEVMFETKIPLVKSSADGCIFLKCCMFFTTVELTLSGALIPDFSCNADGLCVLFSKFQIILVKIILLRETCGIIYRID
jgi:hypothetical protein